jgi:hypothetical protein
MKALGRYFEKERQLLELRAQIGDKDYPEEDAILDAMDPLWWAMTEQERGIANRRNGGRWIRAEAGIVCPFCGHLIEGFSTQSRSDPPPRCNECMTDTIPGEFAEGFKESRGNSGTNRGCRICCKRYAE